MLDRDAKPIAVSDDDGDLILSRAIVDDSGGVDGPKPQRLSGTPAKRSDAKRLTPSRDTRLFSSSHRKWVSVE
jgi:hypothetical protein